MQNKSDKKFINDTIENQAFFVKMIKEQERENAKLNAIIDSYQPKIQALKDENKQLKELFEIESLTDIKTGETMYRSRQIMHFVDILQEIKKYINSQGIDNSWNMRIQRFRMGILDLITKAEEE